MQDKLQKAMMALQLLQMLRKPQQDQRELEMRQQMAQQENAQRRAMMEQNQKQSILQALTGLSRDPMTGVADPRMVLEYLKQNFGVNISQPQPTVDPRVQWFNQQQTGGN